MEQRITLASDFYLFDTPGMLWPRIIVTQSGYHLAASGGVGRNAFDEEEVALALLASVRERYAERLRTRYKLDDFSALSDEALLAAVGRKRGGLLPGGKVNVQKAAEVLINDLRSGAWGRITLETPEQFAQWWAAGLAKDAERAVKKAARKRVRGSGVRDADSGDAPGLDDADDNDNSAAGDDGHDGDASDADGSHRGDAAAATSAG
jgi:ribosome biogenesis GTPase A